MNRFLGVLGLLLAVSTAAYAQFGLTAGGNFATLATKTSGEYYRATARGQPGYQAGFFYEKKVTNRWSGLLGLSYSRQSMNLSVEEYGIAAGGYAGSYRLNLNYLSLPVLARLAFGRLYFEAGPQLSILQAAHEKGTETFRTFGGESQPVIDHQKKCRHQRRSQPRQEATISFPHRERCF